MSRMFLYFFQLHSSLPLLITLSLLFACWQRDVDVVAKHAGTLSRTVWNVLRGAVLLWETHSRAVENREQQLEEQLRLLRCEHDEEIKVCTQKGSTQAVLKGRKVLWFGCFDS